MRKNYYENAYEDVMAEDQEYNGGEIEDNLDETDFLNEEEFPIEEDGEEFTDECADDYDPAQGIEFDPGDQLHDMYGVEYSVPEWQEMIQDYKSENLMKKDKAMTKIYCSLYPFIKYLATRYYKDYMPKHTEDLESAGKIGLFSILNDYDPTKAKPTTWFSRAIIHEMRDYVDREIHHTTPHYQNHLREIRRYINDRQTKGVPYTIDDIMIATGYPKQTIINCTLLYERNQNQISMNQCMESRGGMSIMESISAVSPDPEDVVIENERNANLKAIMEQVLSKDELNAIRLKHGFVNNTPRSAADIAAELGLKKQDIRPMISSAERKIRGALRKADHVDSSYVKEIKQSCRNMGYMKADGDFCDYEFEEIDF